MNDITKCHIPPGSLLAKFAAIFPSPLIDCFNLSVKTDPHATDNADGFADSFFGSAAFKPGDLLRTVSKVYPFPSVIDDVENPQAFASGFSR